MTTSWWLLLLALWCAGFTLVALWPPRGPSFLIPTSFFVSWLTIELAVWHLLWQVTMTVALVASGALDSWPGWLGLAVLLVSWAGLVAAAVGASRTDRAFDQAFVQELGPDWRKKIDTRWLPPRPRVGWARMVPILRIKRRWATAQTRDLQYADDGLRRHRLDVWCRDGAGPAAPVLLQIHGGGWMIGSKEQQARPLMYELVERGWVCVAINYRLSPKATWPEHLVDCKLAIKWIREHIAEYGGDPEYLVVTGGSAGGHLAAMVGLTANQPEFQPGFENVDTTVRGVVPFYGVFDFLDRHGFRGGSGQGFQRIAERHILKAHPQERGDVFAKASPLDQVHRHAPPMLIVHGDLDVLAPVQEARLFAHKLRETSDAPIVYVELAGAQHAFDMFHSIRGLHTVAAVNAFLAWLLSRDGKTSDVRSTPKVPTRADLPVTKGASWPS